jgi:hypothetical protein
MIMVIPSGVLAKIEKEALLLLTKWSAGLNSTSLIK